MPSASPPELTPAQERTLAALGAFHGLNPGMGWLFAVALGLQERRLGAVAAALGPIALGHALAIGTAAVAVGVLGVVLPAPALLVLGGAALLSFAAYKVATRFRHPRWIGMRVTSRQLVLWSFVMATAHGAGLMLVPVLLDLPIADAHAAVDAHADHALMMTTPGVLTGAELAAVGVHTAAMYLVMSAIALLVFEKVGVAILRRAWFNLDRVWAGALIAAGMGTLLV